MTPEVVVSDLFTTTAAIPTGETTTCADASSALARATPPLVGGDNERSDVLRVECTKCPRKGRYSVRRLIEKYGRKANMMRKEQLNSDCPKRDAHGLHE